VSLPPAPDPPDAARSRVMRAVRSRDTGPELAVRRMLHSVGYRFRLDTRDLPGRPDLAFRRRRKAIFVHGCFWHGHDCKRGRRTPARNAAYWSAKIARNVARDEEVRRALCALGWESAVVWECALRDCAGVEAALRAFLGPASRSRPGRGLDAGPAPTVEAVT
jgi:DNA mismatch endonuclease (patch repair protein)